MDLFQETVTPFVGTDTIKLNMTLADAKHALSMNKVPYNFEVWPNKGCTPEIPWQIIKIPDVMSMFFAKEKLFKISFKQGYSGNLSNGVSVGMPIDEAMSIDNTLSRDDDYEDYVSANGYWADVSPSTHKIDAISVFIKEVQDEDAFFTYEWCGPSSSTQQ